MSNIAIKAENLSKAYQLGEIGTGTISRDLERWVARLRGKEDPFLRIGETNDRTNTRGSDIIWSLKDINFEIEQGDAVGIIGRNGAGKSTLLKILSKVTSPTTGKISGKGRIASLLEVGTGFHPDLTGRENIFLNGAILGMRKSEIKKHFDNIVNFAGVERYIDTPVKRYSSGMYVRLAFAVAAHLESEILIVDEVLAVGDAEFQKKCLGKMGDISLSEGRTVLFVSHNMGSVAQLCKKGILLDNGIVKVVGSVSTVVESYINSSHTTNQAYQASPDHTAGKMLHFTKVELTDSQDNPKSDFDVSEDIYINLSINATTIYSNLKFTVTIQGKNGDYLATLMEDLSFKDYSSGIYNIKVRLHKELIAPNSYYLRLAIFTLHGTVYDLLEMICPFKIYDTGTKLSSVEGIDYGHFLLKYDASINKVS